MMQSLQLPCSQSGLLLHPPRCQGLSTQWAPPVSLLFEEGSNSLLEHSERVCWSLLWPSDAAESAKSSLLLTEQPSSREGALCWGQLLWRWGATWPSELLCSRGWAGGCAQLVFASLRRAALTAVGQWLSLLLEEVPVPKNIVAEALWVRVPSLSCGVVTRWCPQHSSCDVWHLYKSVTYWKHLISW